MSSLTDNHPGASLPDSFDSQLALLAARPNVIITPHMAFLTQDALVAIAETTVKNLTEFAAGGPYTNEAALGLVAKRRYKIRTYSALGAALSQKLQRALLDDLRVVTNPWPGSMRCNLTSQKAMLELSCTNSYQCQQQRKSRALNAQDISQNDISHQPQYSRTSSNEGDLDFQCKINVLSEVPYKDYELLLDSTVVVASAQQFNMHQKSL
eukprot:6213637-Pleurochrysis_carterae.AAC.2